MFTSKILIPLCLSLTLVSPLSVRNSSCEEDLRLNINLAGSGLQRLKDKFLSSSLINSLHLEDNQIWNIAEEAFVDLTNLQYLNLAGNLLPYSKLSHSFPKLKTLVLDKAFTLVPQEDLQESFTTHCSPCLSKLPQRAPRDFGLHLNISGGMPELEQLHLRSNNIMTISGLQNTPNLTHLYLGSNHISRGFSEALVPPTLKHLHLENNFIESFNSSVTRQLEELVLDHNNIYRLCSDNCSQRKRETYEHEPMLNLAGAVSLQILSVADNLLMYVDEGAFDDLESLQFLNLSGNYLEIFPLDVFGNLTNLKSLALSDNFLKEIPDVDDLEELEVLLLNGNGVKTVTQASFTNLPKLKTLSFANNHLSEIDAGSFDALTSLNELDLSGNKLLILPENWIAGSFLQRLHLDSNSFTGIENMSLNNASCIEYLSIAGNPLVSLSTKALMKLPKTVVINIGRRGAAGGERREKCQCDNLICEERRFKNFEGLESMERAQ